MMTKSYEASRATLFVFGDRAKLPLEAQAKGRTSRKRVKLERNVLILISSPLSTANVSFAHLFPSLPLPRAFYKSRESVAAAFLPPLIFHLSAIRSASTKFLCVFFKLGSVLLVLQRLAPLMGNYFSINNPEGVEKAFSGGRGRLVLSPAMITKGFASLTAGEKRRQRSEKIHKLSYAKRAT